MSRFLLCTFDFICDLGHLIEYITVLDDVKLVDDKC